MSLAINDQHYSLMIEPIEPISPLKINIPREGFHKLIVPLINHYTASWSKAYEWFQLSQIRSDSIPRINENFLFFKSPKSKCYCTATAHAVFSIFVDYSPHAHNSNFQLEYMQYKLTGVNAFKEKIESIKAYPGSHGLAALCSIRYEKKMKKHSFVIEMTSEKKFLIYQSYLAANSSYSLEDYLKKQRIWTEQELLNNLLILESEYINEEKKTQVYFELFDIIEQNLPVFEFNFISVTYTCTEKKWGLKCCKTALKTRGF